MRNIIWHIISAAKLCLLLTVCKILAACPPPARTTGTSYFPIRYRYYSGQRIYYRCQTGYETAGGSRSRQCTSSNQWTGSSMNCIAPSSSAPTCSRPSDPPNGEVYSYPPSKQEFSNNEHVEYRCNRGYQMYGSSTVFCLRGQWSHAPVCNAITQTTCPHRSPPSNARYAPSQTSKTTWYVREIAIFMCNSGYSMTGKQLSVCMPSGSWSSSMPHCERDSIPTCPHRFPPLHGRYVPSQQSKTTWNVQDRALYICNNGYSIQGNRSSTCLSSLSWSSAVPTCRRVCPHRSPPAHGTYTRLQKARTTWHANDQAAYVCNDGYVLTGSRFSRCLSTGRWSSGVPSCSRGTCPYRNAPVNGRYVQLQRNRTTWFIGDEAAFVCNDGYMLSGISRSRCLPTGRWSNALPACGRRHCTHRLAPQYGSYVDSQRLKQSWYVREAAQFRCNDHYVMSGSSISVCLSSGNWSSQVPRCQRTCKHRPAPTHGRYVEGQGRKQVWYARETATFRCNSSYVMSGSASSVCMETGNWSTGVPFCHRTCPNRPAPSNGAYVRGIRTPWRAEDEAVFSCDSGYAIIGETTSICQASGVWTYAVPTCVRMCPHRSPPKNGAYSQSQRVKNTWYRDDEANFVCNEGYIMSGRASSRCLSSGRWSHIPPTCERLICPHRLPPRNGRYTSLQQTKIVWYIGNEATYVCNDGYVISGNTTSRCLSSGRWSGAVPTCERRTCPNRPAPTNGSYVGGARTFYAGSTASFSCDTGYVISGSDRSFCQSSGRWASSVPTCRRVCPHRFAPENGQYTRLQARKTFWYVGEAATFVCNDGHVISGSRTSRCLSTGRWSEVVPTCPRRTCPHRTPPQNGGAVRSQRTTTQWFVGDVAEYVCSDGYFISGSGRSRCLSTGRWSEVVPTCERRSCPSRPAPTNGAYVGEAQTTWNAGDLAEFSCSDGYTLFGSSRSLCQSTGRWSTSIPTCRRICPHRPAPGNGLYTRLQARKTLWYVGDEATYICSNGYVLSGSRTSRCLSTGKWSEVVPTCERRTCPHRPSPQNGGPIQSQRTTTTWLVDDVAIYVCRDGYAISGSSRSRCLSTGRWSEVVPTCERPTCPNRPAPANGAYVGGSRTQWFAGDVASFTCDAGYALSGEVNSTCQSSRRWSSLIPTCHRTCPHRSAPQNGAYVIYQTSKTSWYVGERASYVCNDGYILSGSRRSSCLSSGSWSESVPTCERRTCPHRRPPQYGSYVEVQSSKTTWYAGETATFVCNSTHDITGPAQSVCLSSGTWSTRVPTCRLDCVRPRPPANGTNGTIHSTPFNQYRFRDGEYIEYRCNDGYSLRGGSSRIFCSQGSWTRFPLCIKIQSHCPHRKAPRNGGYIEHQSDKTIWQISERARYYCNEGYSLMGSTLSRCMTNGRWTSTVPRCRQTCPSRPSPYNGAYIGGLKTTWYLGDVAQFRCNKGYKLTGQANSTCKSSGMWSYPVPGCMGTAASVLCPHRVPPTHGTYVQSQQTKTDWRERDVARFECNSGYAMVGDQRSTCSGHGHWKTDVPTCRQTCPHRSGPSYGSYIHNLQAKRVWYVGDTATYKCNHGYVLESANAYCLRGGHWSAPVPKCTPKPKKIVCHLPRTPRNGRIRTEPAGKREFNDGEFIYIECNQHYRLVGNRRVGCYGRKWTAIPVCQPTIMCPHRPAPENGFFILGKGQTVWYSGDSARFECHPGYVLHGNNHVTCQGDARWSSALPTCAKPKPIYRPPPPPPYSGGVHPPPPDYTPHKVTCPHRPPPLNGVYIQDQGKTVWKPGDIARYRCNPNFILVGHDYTNCREDGTWRFDVPFCQNNHPQRTYCVRPQKPAHGFIQSYPAHKRRFAPTEYVMYSCKPGFVLHGPYKVFCRERAWSANPTCIPAHPSPIHPPHPGPRVSCPTRDPPEHGFYTRYQTEWHNGDIAEFTCPEGYVLVGQSRSACQADGSWQHGVPTCERERPTTPRSCQGQCGAFDVGGCTCDDECSFYFDCCDDYQSACGNSTVTSS